MYYKFAYRRGWFWKSFMVTGHKWEPDQDKMLVYFKDGGVREIKHWRDCEIKLGADWYAETKREMEKAAGQPIGGL